MLTVSRSVAIPLATNADGSILIANTRVTLDTVIACFKQAISSVENSSRSPSLKLSDVYSTIAFYLNYQQEVEEYLQQRQTLAQEIRKQNQLRFDSQNLRDRLLSRQAKK